MLFLLGITFTSSDEIGKRFRDVDFSVCIRWAGLYICLHKQNNHIVSIDAVIIVSRTKFNIISITMSVVCMDLFDICRSVLFLLFAPVDFYRNPLAATCFECFQQLVYSIPS